MYLTDAHDSLYKSVFACTNSAVADGAIDHIRQPELNVRLWADIKKEYWCLGVIVHING